MYSDLRERVGHQQRAYWAVSVAGQEMPELVDVSLQPYNTPAMPCCLDRHDRGMRMLPFGQNLIL